MKIGFDAKRAFHNKSGLGNYSRNTIELLSSNFPENEYFAFTPSLGDAINFKLQNNTKSVVPQSFIGKTFKPFWRSYLINNQILSNKIDIYHGLSNELPNNIEKLKTKSIITIHDLIFIRYPELYKAIDRKIYLNKLKKGCNQADKIIAISEQTKSDLINYLNIDDSKIEVVYQSCNIIFTQEVSQEKKQSIRTKIGLPKEYILYVGTIEKRKNLLSVIKAINIKNIETELVVVGRPTTYLNEIKEYIIQNKLEHKIHFYHNIETNDLPAIYQMAKLFVYPSTFEGFGIPIIEALNSKIPVITSTGSCFSEAGGKSTIYVENNNIEALSESILKVLEDNELSKIMISEGIKYVKKFDNSVVAENLMRIYKTIY